MVEATGLAPPRDDDSKVSRLRPWMVPVFVGFGYLSLQILLNDFSRALEWDEAVYLTEVVPGRLGLDWTPHRARGISWLAWPVAVWDPPIWVIRTWFAMLNSALLAALVWVWWRTIRWSAFLAGLTVSTMWLAVFYGPEVAPNLPAAILMGIATGLMIRADFATGELWARWAAAVAIAAATVIRPTDALVFAAATAVLWFRWDGRRSMRARLVMISVAAGAIPWVVEAYVGFGGVAERLRLASAIVGPGPDDMAIQHLRLLKGPLVGPAPWETIPPVAVAWLVVLIGLGLLGLLIRRKGTSARVVRLLMTVAAAEIGFYLFGLNAVAPRYLLTAYVFMALAGSFVLPDLSGDRLSAKTRLLLILVTTPLMFTLLHASVVERVQAGELVLRTETEFLGTMLAQISNGDTCAFASDIGYPQIQYYSGCRGEQLPADLSSFHSDRCHRSDLADHTFVIMLKPRGGDDGLATWSKLPVRPVRREIVVATASRSELLQQC